MVEFSPATRETRVRFPANAQIVQRLLEIFLSILGIVVLHLTLYRLHFVMQLALVAKPACSFPMWSSGEDLALSPPWPGFDSRHGN